MDEHSHDHGHSHAGHDHSHEHSEHGYGHHDARYNAEYVLLNLLAIQEHYTHDPCADCLTKHWNLVRMYAEEGMTLDNADKVRDLMADALTLYESHFKTIVDCAVNNVCKVRTPDDMLKMLHEVRALRRKISQSVYGLDGDVAHDILAHSHN